MHKRDYTLFGVQSKCLDQCDIGTDGLNQYLII